MIRKIPLKDLVPNEGQIEGLPTNPRFIRDKRFDALCASLQADPEMLDWRPLLVYPFGDKNVIIAGNMRHRALTANGYTEPVPCEVLDVETPVEKLRAYTIKDNVGFGDDDHELLANNWDADELLSFGMELPWLTEETEQQEDDETSRYTRNIKAPIYEPSDEKPAVKDLYDSEKTEQLIRDIHASKISSQEKDFLIKAASRHIVFKYQKIADFYAHSSKEVQELMERSALVIIDFEKAIEYGFVELTKSIQAQYSEDMEDDDNDAE